MEADDVAVSLRGAAVKVAKAACSGAGAANPPEIPPHGRAKAGRLLRHSAFLALKHGVVPVLSPIGTTSLHGNADGARYHPEI